VLCKSIKSACAILSLLRLYRRCRSSLEVRCWLLRPCAFEGLLTSLTIVLNSWRAFPAGTSDSSTFDEVCLFPIPTTKISSTPTRVRGRQVLVIPAEMFGQMNRRSICRIMRVRASVHFQEQDPPRVVDGPTLRIRVVISLQAVAVSL
jgi:hypothetical protein